MSTRELRKRPAREAPAAAPPAKKKAVSEPKAIVKKAVAAVKEKVTGTTAAAATTTNGSAKSVPEVGDVVDLADFGGEFETQDGKKVTLKQLVDESKGGVVLFTYPKASTPGCTTQACLFRDGYDILTSSGLSIYVLSGDSPRANTTFKTKHTFPYDLLCNPSYSLIGAIGLQDKPAKRTKRGVFIVDKAGKVLAQQRGGPQATVDATKEVVDGMGSGDVNGEAKAEVEDKKVAETAGEVADAARAAKLDSTPQVGTPA